MWTLTDFRRKLLRFERPINPAYHVSDIPKFYSNHLDWDKMYVAGPKLANSCRYPIYNIKYPVLYEEHVGGDCGVTCPYCKSEAKVPLGNTRFLLLLLLLGATFVIMGLSR
jgi:hypothetical protein